MTIEGPCPKCGAVHDMTVCLEGDEYQPNVGDVIICCECGEVLIFEASETGLHRRVCSSFDRLNFSLEHNRYIDEAQEFVVAQLGLRRSYD
jgi:hypothetical protein